MCVQAVINDMYCLTYIPKNWLLPVYREAIVSRNLTIPQFDGNRKHYNEANKFKDIVSELKRLLQRETSIPFGFIDANASLEEVEIKVNYLKSLLENNQVTEENTLKKK